MVPTVQDLYAIAPVVIVSCTAFAVLIIESLAKRTENLSCTISIVGLVLALVITHILPWESGLAFSGMVTSGGFSSFFSIVFLLAGVLTVMLSHSYIKKDDLEHGEYYSLVLIAIVGMMLMASAADLIVLFLGLEVMSVSFYVLAGFARRRLQSNEAALKYFLLGAFATGFLLYGIALLYGSAGTTNIDLLVKAGAVADLNYTFLIGLGLFCIGLLFKVAAVPFHMWVPDVYEGSPTTISGFMSTGGKAAAFSAVLLVFGPALVSVITSLQEVLAIVAVLSMVVGNIIALAQTSIKRMLAYSSIAHAGYILVGIVAANSFGSNGALFYLMAYTVMNIGAFGVLSLLESNDGQNLTFQDYAGLSVKRPGIAALMALFMFSLTGIPPFAGFFGKYYVFAGAVQAGYTWLAIIGVLMSVVSAYYYLRLVVLMYFNDQVSTLDAPAPRLAVAALFLSAIAIVEFGIFPSTILQLTSHIF